MIDELFNFYKNALGGAISAPLCAEYKGYWQAAKNDKEKLVQLAMSQQAIPYFASYCNMKLGVTKDYILSNFGKYINGYTIHDADGVDGYTYGLYVDWDYDADLEIDKNVSHIMWTKGANIVVPQTKCPVIYISNGSDLHLICDGFNSVKLYLFDNSRVTIDDCDDTCDILVYKYSDKCVLERGRYCLSKDIYEHRKELRL